MVAQKRVSKFRVVLAPCPRNRSLALKEDVFSVAVDGVEVSFCKLLPATICLPSQGVSFWAPPMVPGVDLGAPYLRANIGS